MAQLKHVLTVYLPDTRSVELSRYGRGNLKIGANVFTYSRLAGFRYGTCPGSSDECERICYAKRIEGPVKNIYAINSCTDQVPPIPDECRVLRLHVSGDFDSVDYVKQWVTRLQARPDVHCWAYTRSWRVASLLPALEELRILPNMQLFASMDKTINELPPDGWRRAWIDGDMRAGEPLLMRSHGTEVISKRNLVTFDDKRSFVCPEETKHKQDCESCRYCIDGQRNDVVFLEH
jgi:hypothetical protein